ncbi:shootin-1 [Caerostris extrusa]|uniref:Shootin-1 n=1 Tax=Caerostris extrusa TaxID=172846 RepID=A0AAV4TGD5_CAEEX|nr:shootin-1 [Caerostris extrusa]
MIVSEGVVCLLTYISHTLGEIMEKKPFKKSSFKEQECSYREQYNILDEKYSKIKDILKQVLKELKEIKIEKQHLTEEYEKLATEVKEKDALLGIMQSVSEAVIDEYNALKLKCDLEAEAATNAIKRATKYFKENQKLKRNTLHENQSSDMPEESDEILSQDYGVDENISELDVLNKLSSELRTEISNLKVQLDKEIEKQNSLKEDFEIAKYW